MLVRDGQNMIQGLSKIELENCQNCCCIVSSCQKKRLSSYCCLLCHRIRHVMSRFCQNHVRVKSGSCQGQCRVICKGHVKIISKAVRVMQGPFQDHVKVRLCQGHFCLSNIAQPWRLKGFSVLFCYHPVLRLNLCLWVLSFIQGGKIQPQNLKLRGGGNQNKVGNLAIII